MSTPRSEQRKSARVKQESFAQEYQKLQDAADAAKAKQKPAIPKLELRDINGSDSPKKTQDQSAWKSSQSDRSADSAKTQTQTITTTQTTTTTQTDPMAHTAPVITPRKQTRFAPATSSDGGPSQEKTSARSEKAVDSPRRTKLLQREPVQSRRSGSPSVSTTTTPSSSPAVTPREKDQFESPRALKANQFRKKISTTFSKVALDLSKINEKLSPGRNSPPSSPGSAGRISPSKITPRKKESAFIKSLSLEVRNSAAKCFIKLQKEGNFQTPFSARERLVLNAGMIGVLSDHGIKYDLKNLEALAIDAENRSKNHSIDMEIDLTQEPHCKFFKEQFQFFEKQWNEVGCLTDGSEITGFDKGTAYTYASKEEKENMHLCFSPFFLRDFFGGKLTLAYEDDSGRLREINSLEQFEIFLNEGDAESEKIKRMKDPWQAAASDQFLRSKYITHFSSQLVSNAVGAMGFGIDPSLPSYVKFHDGTPIIPKGDVKIGYVFKKTSDGGMDMRLSYELKANFDRLPVFKDGSSVTVDTEATAAASLSFRFSKDRDIEISPLRLQATGWTLELEGKKFGK